jgi:hypothetical protein
MNKRLIFVAALALSFATPMLVAGQAPANVTGKWLFTVETSAGGGMPTVTLKQEGEKLTGHYSSAQLGEADLTGSVKGTAITFSFGTDVQGTHLDVTYTGTIDGKDSMKGKVNLGGLGEGTFVAKRQS